MCFLLGCQTNSIITQMEVPCFVHRLTFTEPRDYRGVFVIQQASALRAAETGTHPSEQTNETERKNANGKRGFAAEPLGRSPHFAVRAFLSFTVFVTVYSCRSVCCLSFSFWHFGYCLARYFAHKYSFVNAHKIRCKYKPVIRFVRDLHFHKYVRSHNIRAEVFV